MSAVPSWTTAAVRECGLDQLAPGQKGTILRVGGPSRIACRLMELGFVPGTPVEVVRFAPLGDPVELRIRQVHLSLRRTETRHIHVACL